MLASLRKLDPMRRGHLVIGGLTLLAAGGYLIVAMALPVGTGSSPGPGLFPILVGIGAVLIALLVISESIFSTAGAGEVDWPRGMRLRLLLLFFGLSAAFIVLLPVLGQYIASCLYMIVMLKFFSPYRWWQVILFGTIGGTAISLLFIEVFNIPLPEGIFL